MIFWDSDGTLLYGNESLKWSLVRAFEEFEYAILSAGNSEIRYMIGDNPLTDYQGGWNAML